MKKKPSLTKDNPFIYARKKLGLSKTEFSERILALFDQAERLAIREKQGFRYVKMWREESKVKAHKRVGHFAMVPVSPGWKKSKKTK